MPSALPAAPASTPGRRLLPSAGSGRWPPGQKDGWRPVPGRFLSLWQTGPSLLRPSCLPGHGYSLLPVPAPCHSPWPRRPRPEAASAAAPPPDSVLRLSLQTAGCYLSFLSLRYPLGVIILPFFSRVREFPINTVVNMSASVSRSSFSVQI